MLLFCRAALDKPDSTPLGFHLRDEPARRFDRIIESDAQRRFPDDDLPNSSAERAFIAGWGRLVCVRSNHDRGIPKYGRILSQSSRRVRGYRGEDGPLSNL